MDPDRKLAEIQNIVALWRPGVHALTSQEAMREIESILQELPRPETTLPVQVSAHLGGSFPARPRFSS